MSEVKVLFVCLGNICRSPTAEGVFRHVVEEQGLAAKIEIDSCGTGGWHAGDPPDSRMQSHARKRGYDLSSLRARKVAGSDFHDFDWMLAMDESNYDDLTALQPGDGRARLHRMGEFVVHDGAPPPVPDPYYGGAAGFETVLDMLEEACATLLERIRKEHAL